MRLLRELAAAITFYATRERFESNRIVNGAQSTCGSLTVAAFFRDNFPKEPNAIRFLDPSSSLPISLTNLSPFVYLRSFISLPLLLSILLVALFYFFLSAFFSSRQVDL